MMRMTYKKWPRALLLASMYMMGILGVVASGGGGGSGGESEGGDIDNPPSESFDGIWLGGYQTDLYEDTFLRTDLDDSGDEITGTFEDKSGRLGTFQATIGVNNSVLIEMTETTPGCDGNYTGQGQLDYSLVPGTVAIEFTFTGVNCDGVHANGLGVLIRQLTEVLAWGLEDPSDIKIHNGELYLSDGSEFPLKKISITTGEQIDLAFSMRAITSLRRKDNNLLWTDYESNIGETGCIGAGVRRALVRANADGSNPKRIAVGDFCGIPAQPSAESDGTYAYWVRNDNTGTFFERVPLIGGDPEKLAQININGGTVFTLDSTHIYWFENGGAGATSAIKRCPLNGCGSSNPEVLISGTDFSFSGQLAEYGDSLYVSIARENVGLALARIPKAGGSANDLVPNASGSGLLTDGQNFYWRESVGFTSRSSLFTAPITGGVATPLVEDINLLGGFDISNTHVYWVERTSGTNQFDGKIRRIAKTGGVIQDIKTDAIWPTYIQVNDSDEVIYANGSVDELRDQSIHRLTLSGVTTLLARGVEPSTNIAVDDNYIYAATGMSVIKVSRLGFNNANIVSPTMNKVVRILVDDINVYWTEKDPFGSVYVSPLAGTLTPTRLGSGNGPTPQIQQTRDYIYGITLPDLFYRIPKTGGALEVIADDLAFPVEFVIDEQYGYIVEVDAGVITRIDLANFSRSFAGSIGLNFGGWGLTQDNEALYLINPAYLRRFDKPSGDVSQPYGPVLIEQFGTPSVVEVDDARIYWTENILGVIKMDPK